MIMSWYHYLNLSHDVFDLLRLELEFKPIQLHNFKKNVNSTLDIK